MDKRELERELERLHPASFSWALACCRRDREEAQDVLQETYVRVLEGKARFDGRSTFKTFLFSVIRRTAAQSRRRRFFWELALSRARSRPDASEPAERSDRRLLVGGALGKLARRQRQILELVFGHGMTLEEAARALGVSVGSARVHYDRAKRRLAKVLHD